MSQTQKFCTILTSHDNMSKKHENEQKRKNYSKQISNVFMSLLQLLNKR